MKYSIPKNHSERLLSPPLEELDSTIESNRRLIEGYSFTMGGTGFREFRNKAREEFFSVSGSEAVVLSAHQPGIPHMGVVEKLSLLETLSGKYFAANSVLDTDEMEAVSMRIPLMHNGARATREFHLYRSAVPRAIFTIPAPEKEALDGTFAEIAPCLESTGSQPILRNFRRFSEIHNETYSGDLDLGSLLALYQKKYLAFKNIHELSMSSMCRTESWRIFVRAIIDTIEDFSRIYNECLDRFREVRKIKSAYSPFPNLLRSEEKTELPFWAVGEGGVRSEPFLMGGGKVVDEDGNEIDDSFLIPRAITFTIFARLFLGDLFVHGTGGGNYDRATDMIITAYFGIEPPAYCVTTTTVYPELPIDRGIESEIQRLKQELWEMKQHPEKFAGPTNPLVKEKAAITSGVEGRPDRKTHQRIKEINEKLRGAIAELISGTEEKLEELQEIEQAERPWRRRDFPYFLFGRHGINTPGNQSQGNTGQ